MSRLTIEEFLEWLGENHVTYSRDARYSLSDDRLLFTPSLPPELIPTARYHKKSLLNLLDLASACPEWASGKYAVWKKIQAKRDKSSQLMYEFIEIGINSVYYAQKLLWEYGVKKAM